MATTRFADHLLTGVHASRPAANAVPAGTLYACSTHQLVYQSDGTNWNTWATLGSASTPTLSAVLAAGNDAGATAIINSPITANAQSGTTYTLVLADSGKLVTLTNASAITLTIPLNASVAFAVGTQILLAQLGAGQVTVSPTGGVTMSSRGALTKIAGQYGAATLIKTATDTWLFSGDIA